MKTNSRGKVDLFKRPYLVLYPCCDVLALALETTMCWNCEKEGGRSFYDIPLRHRELLEAYKGYRPSTSTLTMMLSHVDKEMLVCAHP